MTKLNFYLQPENDHISHRKVVAMTPPLQLWRMVVFYQYNEHPKIHEQYGGVVPEVASRQHHMDILPVVLHSLAMANKPNVRYPGSCLY